EGRAERMADGDLLCEVFAQALTLAIVGHRRRGRATPRPPSPLQATLRRRVRPPPTGLLDSSWLTRPAGQVSPNRRTWDAIETIETIATINADGIRSRSFRSSA